MAQKCPVWPPIKEPGRPPCGQLGRRAGEGEPDTGSRTQGEAQARTRAGENRRGLVEPFAECLGGAGSMRRAERGQGEMQVAVADVDIAGNGEQLMQQGSPFLLGTGIVRPSRSAWSAWSVELRMIRN